MRIHKYFHSCLLIEEDGRRLLIDPGNYSFMDGRISPEVFENISLILITHEHADHMDIPVLKIILKNNPSANVLTNDCVKALLAREGIEAIAMDDGEYTIGNFNVQVIPAAHEKLLVPVPHNNALLINNALLHPGDSLDANLLNFKNIKILALPISAPWASVVQIAEFAKTLQPETVIPIHDGYLIEHALERQHANFQKFLSEHGIQFNPLNSPEEFVEV